MCDSGYMLTVNSRKDGKMAQDQLITDLTARARDLQLARGVGEGWVAVDYETEDIKGTGLAAGYHSGAPEVTLDLGLQGQHTLYLALGSETALRVWLDGEEGYREFITQHG